MPVWPIFHDCFAYLIIVCSYTNMKFHPNVLEFPQLRVYCRTKLRCIGALVVVVVVVVVFLSELEFHLGNLH